MFSSQTPPSASLNPTQPTQPPRESRPSHNMNGIRLTNVVDGETVHQRFLLVHGRAGPSNSTGETSITVLCNDFPRTRWPCVNSYFKALVHLVPGPNTVSFVVGQEPSCHFHVNYIPRLQNPPVSLVIFVAADSPCTFDVPPEKANENTLEVAKEKLRMAAYMWQAFCSEQMHRNGFGRRTFRLDEAWLPDTVSHQAKGVQTNTAQVHIIRSKHTLQDIRDIRRAQHGKEGSDNVSSLFALFLDDLKDHFPFDRASIVAGLILDSHWDPSQNVTLGHTALGGCAGERALGIFGSHLLHSWPRAIEDIVPCMMNTTRTDTRYVANDANESGEWWRALNIGMGAMLHELGHALTLTHTASGIMTRGYNNWNRTFIAKEPNFSPIPPEDEGGSHWHRVDAVRLRFHPAFRQEPAAPRNPMGPYFIPLSQNSLEICAPAGLSLVEMSVNGQYRTHLEFLGEQVPHPTSLRVSVAELRHRCQCGPHDRLRLEVTTIHQQTEAIDDVEAFLEDHIVQVPHVPGVVLKSQAFGQNGLGGSDRSDVILLHRPIRAILLYSGSFFDGMVIQWADGGESVLGKKGGSPTAFAFQPGEKMIGVRIRCGAWIDGLQIKTSLCRVSPWCGGDGGELRNIQPPDGYALVGLYATAEAWMDQFGIMYQKLAA